MTTLAGWARAVFGRRRVIEVPPLPVPAADERAVAPIPADETAARHEAELVSQQMRRISAMTLESYKALLVADIEQMKARESMQQARDSLRVQLAMVDNAADAARLLSLAERMKSAACRAAAMAEGLREESAL